MNSLEASYVEKFRCDGSECSSKCCRKWMISIDDDTLRKYKKIKPKAQSEEITKHIKKSKNFNGVNLIELTEDKNCPFIDEDLLCHIQKNYGEGYLSKTCATYPRLNFLLSDDFCLRSLTISCPVACNLVLNQTRPVTFNANKTTNAKSQAFSDMRLSERGYMMPLIQITGANILQYEKLSIDERLGVLALFLESAYEAKDEGELADVSEAFEKEVLKDAQNIFLPLKFDKRKALKTMILFIHKLFTGQGGHTEATLYLTFINKTFELVPSAGETDIVDLNELDVDAIDYGKLEKFFDERFLPAKEELLKENSLQVENFLLHFFLASGAPIKNNIKHFAGGASKFILEYKLAEFVFACFKYAMGEKFHTVAIELAAADFTEMWEHNLLVSEELDKKFADTKEVMPIIQELLDV